MPTGNRISLRKNNAKRMEQPTSAPEETVVWEFWRAGFERSYHGEPGVVELGNIDDSETKMQLHVSTAARILVVEDRPFRRKWFRDRVPQAEFADLPRIAIDLLDQQPFDVCFLDWSLHGFTSHEVAAHISSNGQKVCAVVIHSTDRSGVDLLKRILPDAKVAPFGTFEISRRSS